MLPAQQDTIVALCTPVGSSAIGIIRLSGPQSLPILRKLIASESFNPSPNTLTLRSVLDPASHETLDQALVCYFKAPHSFTGEDVVELHCHGSPMLLRAIIDAAVALNARTANPGEFSLRAVAHGRMKLVEAEAIRDLIEVQTDAGLRQAARQLKGEIAHRLQPAKDDLLRIVVRLESSLEFVEDDLPSMELDEILLSLQRLSSQLEALAQTFDRGRLIRNGIRVTLIGKPNVGKSSIFNKLIGHNRAIVTSIPGTTRDTITETVGIQGVPVLLTDTAGLRASSNPIESLGVDRSRREAADSELLILVLDGSTVLTDDDRCIIEEVAGRRQVVAMNKSDLPGFSTIQSDEGLLPNVIAVSAETEAGIDTLRAAIIRAFTNGHANSEGLLITNARHHDLLTRTVEEIALSENLLRASASEELVLVGLHNALRYLGEITGETTSDEILGQIFSTFCIGK